MPVIWWRLVETQWVSELGGSPSDLMSTRCAIYDCFNRSETTCLLSVRFLRKKGKRAVQSGLKTNVDLSYLLLYLQALFVRASDWHKLLLSLCHGLVNHFNSFTHRMIFHPWNEPKLFWYFCTNNVISCLLLQNSNKKIVWNKVLLCSISGQSRANSKTPPPHPRLLPPTTPPTNYIMSAAC